MSRWRAAAIGLAIGVWSVSAAAETIDGASFGETRVAAPTGAPLRYVTMFSDASGWSADDDRALQELARAGALAVGVDSKIYLDNLAARRGAVRPAECVDVFQDVEDLSRRIQSRHPSDFYNLPIVAGRGGGGALAYVALAQAPLGTLSAAVSLDPAAEVGVSRALCRLDGFPLAPSGGRSLAPVARVFGEWRVGFDARADAADRARAAALVGPGAPAKPNAVAAERAPPDLVALVDAYAAEAARAGVDGLPLVPLPGARASKAMAIFLSGDGGWRDLDKTIGEKLQAAGVPVVGWDSLRYFWRRKSPDETAADLSAVIGEYARRWGIEKVALIGYSFGADVLPAVYNRLPETDRQRVAMISLLGLEAKADWEIRVAGWFGAAPSAAATPLAPELAKIPGGLMQCYYGADEKDSDCLGAPNAELIETPGGHHFGGDYDSLADRLIDGLKRRGAL
jgi:type IV secretory pathway VirJ component